MLLFAALLAVQEAPAPAAAAADAACARAVVALPGDLAAWHGRSPREASTGAGAPPLLPLGQGADFTLAPMERVTFDVAPGKPARPGSFGGMFRFRVEQAGTIRIALGAGAWVDAIRDGKPLESTAHGHGPACSGIAKLVSFAVEPGEYLVELANSPEAVLPVLVTDPE